jgi:HEAT repeat protein
MPIVIFAVIAILIFWWVRSDRTLNRNERLYLKRRGYEPSPTPAGPPIDPDAQLTGYMESLSDISPYSRQRAAEELARLGVEGKRDTRMFYSLVAALDDSEASVRSAVASALGDLADARAVEPLKRQLDVDESILFRAAALKALEKLKERE